MSAFGGKSENIYSFNLPLLNPKPATDVEATSILPFLEREDCTPMACYRSLYAPRAGGAHDSQHRTEGIAGRTRRRGGRMAARGARAAAYADAARGRADALCRKRSASAKPQGDVSARAAAIGLERREQH